MTTIYTLLLLLLFGIVIGWIVMILFPISGLLGILIGGEPGKRSKFRLTMGIIAASICQTYFYLGYVAFIIGWSSQRIDSATFSKYLIWVFVFLSSLLPIWFGAASFKAKHQSKATDYADVTVEASYLTGFLAFIGFFVFVFVSRATFLWTWIPYVGE